MASQVEVTKEMIKMADSVSGEGIELIVGLGNKVYELLKFRPYNNDTKEHEHEIRWKRTAHQILTEGYVYQEKACTDIIIAFLGLANARNFKTKFVKVSNNQSVHSIAEIKISDEWFIYDLANGDSVPIKGQFIKNVSINGWTLWKKGRDAWDLGLSNCEDIKKINNSPTSF